MRVRRVSSCDLAAVAAGICHFASGVRISHFTIYVEDTATVLHLTVINSNRGEEL